MTQQKAPSFSIEKIYVKDLSLEVPNAPGIFLEQEAPEINIHLQTDSTKVGDDIYEATLTVTVSAKIGEKNVYLIEVGQSGIFRISNILEDNLKPLLLIACPNILFPYARQTVSESVTRAGFAPLILQPVNFESIYTSQLQKTETETESVTETEPVEA